MRILAVMNQKGGVAKTTTAVTLAAMAAERGHRVLLVDADPQGNATLHLGIDPENTAGLCGVMVPMGSDSKPAATASRIVPTEYGLDLLPQPSTVIEQRLISVMARREHLLAMALAQVQDRYDLVVIDSPPNFGLLQINVLVASNWILIPFQSEAFGARSLTELALSLTDLREAGLPMPEFVGLLATRCRSQATKHMQEVRDFVANRFGAALLPVSIRETTAVPEAANQHTPLHRAAPHATATQDYWTVHDLILAKMGMEPARLASQEGGGLTTSSTHT